MSELSDLIQKKRNERNDELARYATKVDIRSCRWGGDRWGMIGARLVDAGFPPVPATPSLTTYETVSGEIKPLNILRKDNHVT